MHLKDLHLTPRNGFRATLAAAAAAALIAAGCGSSDDTSSTSSTSTTSTSADVSAARADLISKGDELCTQVGQQISAAVDKRVDQIGENVQNKDLVQIFSDITIPGTGKLYDELAKLKPAPEDADDYQAIIDAGQKAVAKAKADPESLAVIQGKGTPFDGVNQLEQQFGFKVCGAPDPPPNG